MFWVYTKSKTKTKPGISDLEYEDDKRIKHQTQDDTETAEVLGTFFTSVYTNEGDAEIPYLQERVYDRLLSDTKIDRKIVEKKLTKLKPSKSSGPDNIHPRVLREANSVLSCPLAILFQTSIDTGVVPDDWRIAKVSAIFIRK